MTQQAMRQAMRVAQFVALGLWVLLALTGCGEDEDATAIAISVRSDLGEALRSVELILLAPGADPETADDNRRRTVDATADDLPLTLVATKGERDRIQVVVRGLNAEGIVLAQYRATVAFAGGQTFGLPVFLASACLGRLCDGSETQTCYGLPTSDVDMGACGPLLDLEAKDLDAVEAAGDEHKWAPPESNVCDLSDLDEGECTLTPQCGCGAGEACRQAPDGELRCTDVGDLGVNEGCRSDTECAPGLACNYGLCLPYCAGNPECGAGGVCLSVVDDVGSTTDTNVCFIGCDPEAEEDGCAGETRCLRLVDGSFCLAPLDPCPFYQDGECDDPSGTGLCAAGTDAPDCDDGPRSCPSVGDGVCDEPEGTGMCAEGSDEDDCCAPGGGLEGDCDPLAQCGCGAGQACVAFATSTATGPVGTAMCIPEGPGGAGTGCSGGEDCGAGLGCIGTICKPYCDQDDECMDAAGGPGRCDQVVLGGEPVPGVKTCIVQCDFDANSGCPDGSTCAGFPLPECHVPLDTCPEILVENGTCDEDIAGGTGICAPGTDAVDCAAVCPISRPPGGDCDLTTQCGCPAGQDCTITTDDLVPACRVVSGTVGTNGLCQVMEDCAAGHACIAGICKRYCDDDVECPGPMGGTCVGINDVDGNPVAGVSVCNVNCDPAAPMAACPAGTLCPNDAGNRCIRPFENCPYTEDRECDEPEGTRLCVEGSDVADCAQSFAPDP